MNKPQRVKRALRVIKIVDAKKTGKDLLTLKIKEVFDTHQLPPLHFTQILKVT